VPQHAGHRWRHWRRAHQLGPADRQRHGGPSHAGGVGGWRCVFGDYEPVGGLGVLYTVQAADVVGGTVTVSMAGRAISGTPPTSDAGSTFTVRKV
jgi:hypothetical protein